jgi:hypothetical protein
MVKTIHFPADLRNTSIISRPTRIARQYFIDTISLIQRQVNSARKRQEHTTFTFIIPSVYKVSSKWNKKFGRKEQNNKNKKQQPAAQTFVSQNKIAGSKRINKIAL